MSKQWNDFNLNDFRKWINNQKDESPGRPHIIGLQIESKVNVKKLMARMDAQEGLEEELAKDFKQNGGVISEVDGNNILVEVESGSFIIHKMYTKRAN